MNKSKSGVGLGLNLAILAAIIAVGLHTSNAFSDWREVRCQRAQYAADWAKRTGPSYQFDGSANDDPDCPRGTDCFWFKGIDTQGRYDELLIYSGDKQSR